MNGECQLCNRNFSKEFSSHELLGFTRGLFITGVLTNTQFNKINTIHLVIMDNYSGNVEESRIEK